MIFNKHLVELVGFYVHLLRGTEETNWNFKIGQTRLQFLQYKPVFLLFSCIMKDHLTVCLVVLSEKHDCPLYYYLDEITCAAFGTYIYIRVCS